MYIITLICVCLQNSDKKDVPILIIFVCHCAGVWFLLFWRLTPTAFPVLSGSSHFLHCDYDGVGAARGGNPLPHECSTLLELSTHRSLHRLETICSKCCWCCCFEGENEISRYKYSIKLAQAKNKKNVWLDKYFEPRKCNYIVIYFYQRDHILTLK